MGKTNSGARIETEKETRPIVFGTAFAPGEFVSSQLRWRWASGMMLA
jgi:hypothetical protein